jgi:hypothetical protein
MLFVPDSWFQVSILLLVTQVFDALLCFGNICHTVELNLVELFILVLIPNAVRSYDIQMVDILVF